VHRVRVRTLSLKRLLNSDYCATVVSPMNILSLLLIFVKNLYEKLFACFFKSIHFSIINFFLYIYFHRNCSQWFFSPFNLKSKAKQAIFYYTWYLGNNLKLWKQGVTSISFLSRNNNPPPSLTHTHTHTHIHTTIFAS